MNSNFQTTELHTATFQAGTPFNSIPRLPPKTQVETLRTLKKAISANRAVAELRAVGNLIPNQSLLLRSIVLQEAKQSSEIENIVTTNDKLYQAFGNDMKNVNHATKEVLSYESALWSGYQNLQHGGFLNTRLFIDIVQTIRQAEVGIRTMPGTHIANSITGKIVYTPPSGESLIRDLLQNLSEYIYAEDDIDALIKMAVLHYQFEAIHPFSDGNGRTGRVLNILYLIHAGVLDIPVLYLSRYIIRNKSDYYEGLRRVTEKGEWEDWILYMLDAVEVMARESRDKVVRIRSAIETAIDQVKAELPRIYSKDLVELLFEQPYIRIQSIVAAGIAQRQTAAEYLKELASKDILHAVKVGRETLYVNRNLLAILAE